MSRRKDRERLLALKGKNPGYPGFRGYDHEPSRQGSTLLTTAVCTVCGRRRNVPVETVQEGGEPFICLSCQERSEVAGTTETDEAKETVSEPEEETPAEKGG